MPDTGRLLIGAYESGDEAEAVAARISMVEPGRVRSEWHGARAAFHAAHFDKAYPPLAAPRGEALREIDERMSTSLFAASLKGRRWRLVNVPIASLLTSQPVVNLARVAAMTDKLRRGLVPLLFPTETTLDVRSETSEGPAISFISDRGELAVSAAGARRVGDGGAIEVVIRIEPRPNYVSVVTDGRRLIVRNGNHRLIAAWEEGLTEVPCVLFDADTAKLAEKKWSKFPSAALLSARPPLLIDLAAPARACLELPLRRRTFVTTVRAEQRSSYEN